MPLTTVKNKAEEEAEVGTKPKAKWRKLPKERRLDQRGIEVNVYGR